MLGMIMMLVAMKGVVHTLTEKDNGTLWDGTHNWES